MIHAKHRSWAPKNGKFEDFLSKALTFKNRYITSKNGSIGRLFVTPPHFLKLAKNRKNVEIHPHFQSAFGTAANVTQ